MDADTRMQSIVLTHSSAIDVFFDIIKKYVVSGFVINHFSHTYSIYLSDADKYRL
jgi:hypothetical protein